MNLIGLFVITCLIVGVPAHWGYTKMCRDCHHVSGPNECNHYKHCPESCGTEVHFRHGAYEFSYSCKPYHECDHHDPALHHHVKDQLVCRECCDHAGCDMHTCARYHESATTTTTAPAPVVTKLCRNCRHVEDPRDCGYFINCTESCATSVHHAHGKNLFTYGCQPTQDCEHGVVHVFGKRDVQNNLVCQECCASTGCDSYACSYFFSRTTAPSPRTAGTTTAATTTTVMTTSLPDVSATPQMSTGIWPATAVLTVTQAPQAAPVTGCTDHNNPAFSCMDMLTYGYCLPSSGAGYELAQKRCQLTCGFCH